MLLTSPITIDEVIHRLPRDRLPQLPAPRYIGSSADGRNRVGLAVESMRRHMTNEGWEIFDGLSHAGYLLAGHRIVTIQNETGSIGSLTNVPKILQATDPGVVVMQDKREWDTQLRDFRDKQARFEDVRILRESHDVFKLTILKDSHQRPAYHRQSADEIGCHAWVVYYNPRIVQHLAPYVRPQHLIRVYHTINSDLCPDPQIYDNRNGCLLSGAISGAYPLRTKLVRGVKKLPKVKYLPHPGYHMRGCATPSFLKELVKYKVAICTASVYGYALRKIIEATACGCIVVTDLPVDEVMPHIDGNLVRVHPSVSIPELNQLLITLYKTYSPEKQATYAIAARKWYDYRTAGYRLADDIETLRSNYNASVPTS